MSIPVLRRAFLYALLPSNIVLIDESGEPIPRPSDAEVIQAQLDAASLPSAEKEGLIHDRFIYQTVTGPKEGDHD